MARDDPSYAQVASEGRQEFADEITELYLGKKGVLICARLDPVEGFMRIDSVCTMSFTRSY